MSFVVQLPREVSRLVQRVGRSGHRVGRTSAGTIIATSPDDVAEAAAIAEANSRELEGTRLHERPKDVLANQLVGLALDFGDIGLEGAEIVWSPPSGTSPSRSWRRWWRR